MSFFNSFFSGGMGGGMDEEFFTGGGRQGGKQKKEVENSRFYEILGVPKTASSDEIRKAYRKLAGKLHPDKEGGSQEKFQELQAAYDILSDPEKKQIYDKYGEDGLKDGMGGGGEGMDIFDLLMNRGGGQGKKAKPKSKSIMYPLKVSLEDVYCGRSKYLEISRYRICGTCDGSGSKVKGADTKCGGCKGQGRKTIVQKIPMGYVQNVVDCDECRGSGYKIADKDKCTTCKGQKAVTQTKSLEIHVDKGATDGKKYTFAGESDEVPDVTPGDVIVEIQVEKHPLFTRKGADLIYKAKISLLQALTGFETIIEHLDKRKIKISTKPGEVITPGIFKTCKEMGMPFLDQPYKFGNLFIDFEFVFPSKISPEQKESLFKIFPNDVPKPIKESVDESYTLTDFKKEDENSGKTKDPHNRMDEDDDEYSGGGHRNVQCQSQ